MEKFDCFAILFSEKKASKKSHGITHNASDIMICVIMKMIQSFAKILTRLTCLHILLSNS